MNILKVIAFILGLYLAYIILLPLLNFLLGIGFWIFKILIYIGAALLVFHLLFKLIFGIDFSELILGPRWRNRF